MQLLRRMQTLLAQLYDAPVREDVQDFVLSDRHRLREAVGEQAGDAADEQVYVVEEEQGVRSACSSIATCWSGSRGAIRWKRSTSTTCPISARRSKASATSTTWSGAWRAAATCRCWSWSCRPRSTSTRLPSR